MGVIARISLRNLFRQKRRNILLGTAIAVGVMVMVMASSFSRGITDVLFNKIMTYVSGHIAIDFHEKGGTQTQIFRDKERIEKIIKEIVPVYETKSEAIGIFTKAIGNGKSDNVIVVNMDYGAEANLTPEKQKELEESFRMVDGKWEDLKRTDIPNPGVISLEQAKELNVKMGDTVRVRFQNVFGQWQAETITIIGILKNDNAFMSTVLFVDTSNVKRMMGFRPYETAPIQINIKNPKEAKVLADKLHAALKPGTALVFGEIKAGGNTVSATAIGYKTTAASIEFIRKNMKITQGNETDVTSKKWVGITAHTAEKLGIKPGDTVEYSYKNKFEDKITTVKYEISGIVSGIAGEDKDILIMNEEKLYDSYFDNLPAPESYNWSYVPKESEAIYKHLATEWTLLERSKTTDDFIKKMKDIGKKKYKGVTVDVNSMYESASQILNLEYVLKLITGAAGLILFFIILIGVVNTLRMTIRERTREIGTVRAIGMQKQDVRNTFILETLFLTMISSVVGIVLAVAAIAGLSQITFNTEGNPLAMLLVKQHLHFVYAPEEIAVILVFIHVIAVLTAFFPAKKAAEMSPSTALRHYE